MVAATPSSAEVLEKAQLLSDIVCLASDPNTSVDTLKRALVALSLNPEKLKQYLKRFDRRNFSLVDAVTFG